MGKLPEVTSVLIVGGGPCGLTLAIELGRRGIDAVLVDLKPSTAINPQANATQARTMEHFRRLGFADEVRALGLPKDYPTDIGYFTRYGGIELARFRLPPAQQAIAIARNLTGSWSTAELPHRISQKYVEQVLRRHATAQDRVSINYGWRLDDFAEEADGVTAQIQSMETGEQRTLKATYLAGVDGAHSTVRRNLNIHYSGEAGAVRDFFGGKMVAVYLRAPDFYKVMPHDPAWMYWAFNAKRRSWLASVNGKDEFAFHTQLKPGEDETDLTERRARELFSQVIAVPLAIEVLGVDTWIAGHALVAESFGSARVFIGGDAAHLFTPAGGLGYNTAVEDAVNLAWKLAAAVRGKAGPALLSSYAYERRKLAVRNTNYARQLADSIGNFVPHPQLESDTPEGAAARAAAGEHLNGHARREFNIPGITFGGRYDGSPVIISDGAALPEDAANVYVPTASPGGRPPHVWLEDGRSLFDLFGPEWTLLQLGGESAGAEPFRKAALKFGVELKVVKLHSPEVRKLYEADLTLIRPDQIVAWRDSDKTQDCQKLFAILMGYVPAPQRMETIA
jgi:2-polyprenyl-6-methoxyphenol hydroxylase-like FAD-dependent oxidoreductase